MKSTKGRLRVATLAVVAGLTLVNAAPAHAATLTKNCSSTAQMCLHYNTFANGLNAEFGSQTNVWSFNHNVNGGTEYRFKAGAMGSAGANTLVWNNAGSGRNFSGYRNFVVWRNSNYTGAYTTVPYGYVADLGIVQNDNASMAWV